jgi:cytochrome c-type biogenesis protein
MHSSVANQITSGNIFLASTVALIAGLISFFSPCVLPLVPGYLSYAAGMTDLRSKGRVAIGTLLFVLGFSFLFISYGAAFGSLGAHIATHQRGLTIVLGLLTVIMGIIFIFNQKFYRSFKVERKVKAGLIGAPVLGLLFGLGWTPCIGPTLGAVQSLALQSSGALRGAFLSFIYCLGLGIPFLLVGIFFDRSAKIRRAISRHGNYLTLIGGIFLILIGILQVTGEWIHLVNQLRDLISSYSAPI